MSFEVLVRRISPTLKRITYKLNGHFSYFDDEDLYQEALIHLWGDFQKGRLGDKTDSYILQGCYFHLKNYLRKRHDKIKPISLDELFDKEAPDLEEILFSKNIESDFDKIGFRLQVEELQNNGLTKREKEVLSFCLEGLTIRETGKRLGVSHVRVVKIKARIKRKSRHLLTEG